MDQPKKTVPYSAVYLRAAEIICECSAPRQKFFYTAIGLAEHALTGINTGKPSNFAFRHYDILYPGDRNCIPAQGITDRVLAMCFLAAIADKEKMTL